MVERGDALFLLGRESQELRDSASDLEVRGGRGQTVRFAVCDLERPATFGSALDAAAKELTTLDAVVVTAGLFGTQDKLESDPVLLASVLNANFTGTVLFCEEARKRLVKVGGVLCVFSSVAGDRGRKPTVLYGATKAGLSRYLEGLDHRYRGSGLRVVCVKPGFVHTSMTAGLRPPPFAGEPKDVARVVLRAIDRGTPVVYAPPIWRWVMLGVRWLPRFVMRRVNF
jgi:decaprenylphospho-beta-D-erythro-pentofuranosid-2-ulose 2-reductase